MFKWFKDKFDKKEEKKEQDIEIKEESTEVFENDSNGLVKNKDEAKENFSEQVEEVKENIVDQVEEIEEEIPDTIDDEVENIKVDLTEYEKTSEDLNTESLESSLKDDVKESSQLDNTVQEQYEAEEVESKKEANKKQGFFQKMFSGLSKTRDNFTDKINQVLGNYITIDDDLYEDLEDILITADVGVDTTLKLIDNLRETIKREKVSDPSLVLGLLGEEAKKLIEQNENIKSFNPNISPTIVLVVGVNGVGKTTTVGKLAAKYKSEGKKVLLVAADTFRAAATEQLQEWARRTGVDIVHHAEGSDPAAVVYDAIQAAKARNSDIILCDTAGRLHNKANLMNELEKIYRIIDKNFPEANKESLIVLDATTGQNALLQAKQFKEVAKVSGIVITKLDGTAKGGIILPLINELKVPVVYIGVGEQVDDLQNFDSEKFIDSIFVK